MKCISKNIEHEIIINKSKFICNLKYVQTEEDAKEFINKVSRKYNDASHNCYAFTLNQIQRVSDDGEPTGTAGIPMLDVLEKKDLNYIVAIVTRYFGGVKLGAGGLVRAYSQAVSEAIKQVEILDLVKGFQVEIIFSYSDIKKMEHILQKRNIEIKNKEFSEKIKFKFDVTEEDFNSLQQEIKSYNHLIEINQIQKIEIIKGKNE